MTQPEIIYEAKVRKTIKRLRALNRDWPDGIWLFAASGTLTLMKTHPDGTRHIPENGKPHGGTGMDPELIMETFSNISCDGGDW